jgi:hypothetical protein
LTVFREALRDEHHGVGEIVRQSVSIEEVDVFRFPPVTLFGKLVYDMGSQQFRDVPDLRIMYKSIELDK